MLARAVDASSVGLIICEAAPGHRIVHVNAAWSGITGYSAAESVGKEGGSSFLQGEGTDAGTVDAIRAAIHRREPIAAELLNYRKDGTPFWNRLSVDPVLDARGELISQLNVAEARKHIAEGTIRGGMIPKVECCVDAIEEGVAKAHIVDGRMLHAVLLEIFTDGGVGTLLTR